MERMENLLDIMQNILVFCLQLVIIVMLITQSLMLIPGMDSRINLALRLEGEPLKEDMNLYQAGSISLTPWTSLTLELQEYNSRPDVEIELNGADAGTFLRKEISLAVKQGDIISIFIPKDNLPIKIKISKKTPNILVPRLDSIVEGTGRLYFDAVDLE